MAKSPYIPELRGKIAREYIGSVLTFEYKYNKINGIVSKYKRQTDRNVGSQSLKSKAILIR